MKLNQVPLLLAVSVFMWLFVFFKQPDIKTEPTVQTMPKNTAPIAIAIHGGAGIILKKDMSDSLEQQYRQALSEALLAGYAVLEKGGSSIDAVQAAIVMMEDSPLFNAGKGAVLTNQGYAELDASIMDGNTGKAGAVGGVKTVKNPILAARMVMDNSPHVMMIGAGADDFAKTQGLEIVDPDYFITPLRQKALQNIKEQETKSPPSDGTGFKTELSESGIKKLGTVGAVALDKNGNLAAGTSTGGMTNKRFGRIGDSPVIGAGTFASNKTCAVSATGHGEYFIRNVAAYDISALMEYRGLSVEAAARQVIFEKLLPQGGLGGVIAIDKQGNIAMPFNTEGMYRGLMTGKIPKPHVFIFKDE